MINSFFFKYNYLGIIQEYFQPKIGPGKQHSYKKERGCIKLKKLELIRLTSYYIAALKLMKNSVLFLNTFL